MTRKIMFLATVALVAFAGVAYAAGSITSRDIKDSTITGKDVKNRSLTKKDFRGSVRGPRGFQGAPGPQGVQGPAGAQGPAGPSAVSGITAVRASGTVAAGDFDGGSVSCPPGQRVVSGGWFTDAPEGEIFLDDATDDRTGWAALLDNSDSAAPATLEITAYCAGAGQAVAARRSSPKIKAPSGRVLRKLNARRTAE